MTEKRVDYGAHDEAYRQFRAEGREGWDTAEVAERTLSEWADALQSEHVPNRGRTLELGCGAGNLSLWLAGKGYDVSGVDISLTAIEWAREKAQARGLQAAFSVGNVLDLREYPDAAFDLVLDGHCLHCIIGDDRRLFFQAARRALRPGGCLVVQTMCGAPARGWPQDHFDPQSRCIIRDDGLVVRYLGMPDDIVQEVLDSGLRAKDWTVLPARSEEDQDTLLLYAVRPGRID